MSIVQKQINPYKYFNKMANRDIADDSISDSHGDQDDKDDELGGEGKFGVNMVGGMRIKELGDDDSSDEE